MSKDAEGMRRGNQGPKEHNICPTRLQERSKNSDISLTKQRIVSCRPPSQNSES